MKKIILFIFLACVIVFPTARASETNGTIISSGNAGYAWSNQIGWVNFGASNGNVNITDTGFTGYAWSASKGWINLNPTNGGISVATNGTLSGYVWGSNIGWVNFSGVSINSSGKLTGQASGTNIGTLSFNCDYCDVRTDYRPVDYRTSSQSETPSTSSSGGGAVIYSNNIPSHITAYNVPLKILPAQSGTLNQSFVGGESIKIDVPSGVADEEIELTVLLQDVTEQYAVFGVDIVGEVMFDITARFSSGVIVHNFNHPMQVVLTIPENLPSNESVAVYYFDENNRQWVKMPSVVFSDNTASFTVDHLTLFAIFRGIDLPQTLTPGSAPETEEDVAIESTQDEVADVIEEEAGVVAEVEGEGGADVLPIAISPTPVLPITTTPTEEEVIVEETPVLIDELTEETPTEAGFPEIEETSESIIPAELFDIRLILEKNQAQSVNDLAVRVSFQSFGSAPTPVEMLFTILNDKGEEIVRSVDNITVLTEEVFRKQFAPSPELVAGAYVLRLRTLYGESVEDVFEAPFTITPTSAGGKPVFITTLALLLSIIALTFALIFKKRFNEKQ